FSRRVKKPTENRQRNSLKSCPQENRCLILGGLEKCPSRRSRRASPPRRMRRLVRRGQGGDPRKSTFFHALGIKRSRLGSYIQRMQRHGDARQSTDCGATGRGTLRRAISVCLSVDRFGGRCGGPRAGNLLQSSDESVAIAGNGPREELALYDPAQRVPAPNSLRKTAARPPGPCRRRAGQPSRDTPGR